MKNEKICLCYKLGYPYFVYSNNSKFLNKRTTITKFIYPLVPTLRKQYLSNPWPKIGTLLEHCK